MVWKKKRVNPEQYKRNQYMLAGVLSAVLLLALLVFYLYISNVSNSKTNITTTEISESVTENIEPEEVKKIIFDSVALQKIVDDWSSSNTGESSVVIADTDGNVIASKNSEVEYFAASIYKLFVAYAAYQQIDDGMVDPEEIYLNSYTRAECLDLMIRESDNPCAEKYWEELGKVALTNQLKSYGIINTDMTLTRTTATDASLILSRIARREGLSSGSQMVYLDSMREQIYRDGLSAGFDSPDVVVYNKVGTRDPVEYHDTAIIDFKDGRQLIVSVMSKNVGAAKVAELGSALQSAILN